MLSALGMSELLAAWLPQYEVSQQFVEIDLQSADSRLCFVTLFGPQMVVLRHRPQENISVTLNLTAAHAAAKSLLVSGNALEDNGQSSPLSRSTWRYRQFEADVLGASACRSPEGDGDDCIGRGTAPRACDRMRA
jgi:hypothetical protein